MATYLRLIACCHAALHELQLGIVQFARVFVPSAEASDNE